MEAAKLFASKSTTFPIRIATVEIDLDDTDIEVIDLTVESVRAKFLTTDQSKNYANKFKEVLIKGKIRKERVKDVIEL